MLTISDYEDCRNLIIKSLYYKFRLDRYTAEDIFQDTFEHFYKSLDSLNERQFDKKSLAGWLKTVAKYLYLRQFSYKNASKSKYVDKPIPHVRFFVDYEGFYKDDQEYADNSIEQEYYITGNYVKPNIKLIEEDIMKIINRLPDNHRELYLAYIGGYDMNEIAELYNINYSVLGVTLHRIKKKIKTQLIKEGLYCE